MCLSWQCTDRDILVIGNSSQLQASVRVNQWLSAGVPQNTGRSTNVLQGFEWKNGYVKSHTQIKILYMRD